MWGQRDVFVAVVTLIGVAGESGWQERRISLLPGDHAEAGMLEGHGGRDTMAGEATGRKSSWGQEGMARAEGDGSSGWGQLFYQGGWGEVSAPFQI